MLAVQLVDVCKSFALTPDAPVQRVVDNLNLTISAGESVAVMGPSGSGKSTILNLVAGLEQPSSGRILLDQTEVSALTGSAREEFRLHAVSYVFQSFHLLPTLTALENCALVAFEQRRKPIQAILESARATLKELGIADAADKFPHQLSGGMQARVALARALIAEPKLVLADEPTGNLDSKTGEVVLDMLFREQKDRKFTLILVTHDHQAAARAQRIVHLRDGRVES